MADTREPDDTCPNDGALMYKAPSFNWLIAGSESGPNARPYELDWFRSARDQCREAGVPFFLKQLTDARGHKIPFADWPDDLRVRELPRIDKEQEP